MADELLTIAEAAKYLKVSEKTVRRLIKSQQLSASKLGGHSWRIKQSDINTHLESQKNTNGTSLFEM